MLFPLTRHRPRALSLMTFNVLAPCYFRHGGRVESDDRPSFLARAQALIHAIQREQCDVICLQEYWFNREYQAAFRKAFYPSHYIHTLKRPGEKEDGLAIFIARHKFEIHHVQHIDFARAGDRVAMLLHVATKWNRHDAPLLERSFLVVNAHLTFPHCPMYKDMRRDQIDVVLDAVRTYVAREQLEDVPVLLSGDFNDSYDPVHRRVMDDGYASVFAHIHGRDARITHCNHNNREVGVDFVFASHLDTTHRRAHALVWDQDVLDHENDGSENSQLDRKTMQLVPRGCHLSPRRLSDVTRLKRPSFGHDWRHVTVPLLDDDSDSEHDDDTLVDYWRMVSDHRPLVATFDVLPPLPPTMATTTVTVAKKEEAMPHVIR